MCRARGRDAEKSLSFCHLTKQRLINELADGVNERHCWPDDSSPDYRPKFRVFTGKACRERVSHDATSRNDCLSYRLPGTATGVI